MKINRILITPAYAKELLQMNVTNRRVRKPALNAYSRDMKAGKWKDETGELIKISKSNVLLDGQHRLLALIDANVSLYFHVASDVNDDVFTVLDTGKSRGGSDTLQVYGAKNYTRISAIIQSYHVLKRGNLSFKLTAGSQTKLTNHSILEMYIEKESFWQEIGKKADSWYNHFSKILTYSTVGSFYALFYDINPDQAKEFFDQLCIPKHYPKNPTIIILNKKLIEDKISNRKITSAYRNAYILKTWNSFRSNKNIKILSYNPEKETFPEPI